jgi:hypothetical protein
VIARSLTFAALVLALGAAPAAADSGAISDVRVVDADHLSATFTATSDTCGPGGACNWFAYAVQSPADEKCRQFKAGEGRAVWGGDAQSAPGTFTGSKAFETAYSAVVVCLYISHGSTTDTLLAEFRQPYTLALSKSEAARQVSGIIKAEQKRAPRKLAKLCERKAKLEFVCDLGWESGKYVYSGSLYIRETVAEYPYKLKYGAKYLRSCLDRFGPSASARAFKACRKPYKF